MYFLRALGAVLSIEQDLGLDHGNDGGFLADRGIARQAVRVGIEARVGGDVVADGDHGAPLRETASEVEVLLHALLEAVQTLGHLFFCGERKVGEPLIDLDARNDSLLREILGKRRAVACLLARGLVEKNDAGKELLDARRAEKQPAVRAAVFLRAFHANRLETLLAGAA